MDVLHSLETSNQQTQLDDYLWILDLLFLTDRTNPPIMFKLELQSKDKYETNIPSWVTTVKNKIKVMQCCHLWRFCETEHILQFQYWLHLMSLFTAFVLILTWVARCIVLPLLCFCWWWLLTNSQSLIYWDYIHGITWHEWRALTETSKICSTIWTKLFVQLFFYVEYNSSGQHPQLQMTTVWLA